MALNPKLTKDAQGVWWLDFDKDQTAEGYAFTTPGGASRTFDPNHTHVKIGSPTEPFTVTVTPLQVTSGPTEAVSQPPTPPPPTGRRLGFATNNGFQNGTGQNEVKQLGIKIIRSDYLSASWTKFGKDNGCRMIVCATDKSADDAVALSDQYPDAWLECDNEPYFKNKQTFDLEGWAKKCEQIIARLHAKGRKVLVPLYLQADGGNFPVKGNTGGTWQPWANQIVGYAPGIKQADGFTGHPYSKPRNAPPQWDTFDKVQKQLVALGCANPVIDMTEVGWSVGTGTGANQEQTTLAKQAEYIDQLWQESKQHAGVGDICIYCPATWGTGFEQSFGVFNSNWSRRPAADVIDTRT